MPLAIGVWAVEVMNGLTMPAPTNTGHILRYGVLRLAEDQNGSVEYCTALPPKENAYPFRWRFLDKSRLEFSYFNTTGSQPAADTATVSGQSMNYRPKVVESEIGASNWRLRLVGWDPAERPYSCNPLPAPDVQGKAVQP
jgi:hypothetical protein